MSGLIDLTGIALRAYSPGAKQSHHTAVQSDAPEARRPAKSVVGDRRLAPAFFIDLSLAAQKALAEPAVGKGVTADRETQRQAPTSSTVFEQFSDGVGRREVPLASDQRDIPVGSRINIRI